jgi:transcription antitermination factor NusG
MMLYFQRLSVFDAFEAGASVIIEDGPLQGLRATVLGVVQNRIVVTVALADRVTAFELDPACVRLDSIAAPAAALVH